MCFVVLWCLVGFLFVCYVLVWVVDWWVICVWCFIVFDGCLRVVDFLVYDAGCVFDLFVFCLYDVNSVVVIRSLYCCGLDLI